MNSRHRLAALAPDTPAGGTSRSVCDDEMVTILVASPLLDAHRVVH